MTEQNRLIVFGKIPELGKVKTRLAKSIGDEKALAIYHALVKQSAKVCADTNCSKVVYYTPTIPTDDYYANETFYKKIQSSGELGERMSAAFEAEFAEGYKNVLIVGSDCYDLNQDHIHKAFDLLESNDVVIGPANDGGYYLLAMRQFIPDLFTNKNWSTPKLIHETKDTLTKLNLSYALLEELTDLDEIHEMPEALKHLL